MKLSILFFCLITIPFYTSAQVGKKDTVQIIKKPIIYNSKRKALSVDYMKRRHGLDVDRPVIQPKMIILHYTAGGNLQSCFNYFNRIEIEDSRPLNKKQSTLNVSAHYLVDRDGKIYQLLEDTLFARHAIGLNYCAIGVENIGSEDNPLTKAQVLANVALVKHLQKKFPQIEYLVGHSEYMRFKGTPMWKEADPKYITYKSDPGEQFMKNVRDLLRGYVFKDRF